MHSFAIRRFVTTDLVTKFRNLVGTATIFSWPYSKESKSKWREQMCGLMLLI